MGPEQDNSICQRVAAVRCETCGPRGKARFAKQLGISPSTYDYYESARVPPAELLVKIADVGEVDLRWLLTGESSPGAKAAANHPALRRAAELIGDHPQAAEPLLAFLDILEGTFAFPAKESSRPASEQAQPTTADSAKPELSGKTGPSQAPLVEPVALQAPLVAPAAAISPVPPVSRIADADAKKSWIPILGRSAAGVPQFWSADEEAAGLTTLGDLIRRCTDSPTDGTARPGRAVSAAGAAQPVQIITLRTPVAWGKKNAGAKVAGAKIAGSQVAQFVVAAEIKANYPDAFAVQIDGDSMTPEIRHGDLVVLSASAQAVAGQPAVVQLAGAIGVTCKLYHPAGKRVNLVPINEQVPPTTVEAGRVEWALRVLARIEPAAGK